MQNWKRIVYTIAAIQIGTGISIIGVVAFIPLFLTSELGVTDPGEAAFWAGLISGVTPFFVAIAAPFWSMQADRRGPRFALSMILFILGVVIALMYFTRSPVELLILRMIQGMSGGFLAVGMSLVMNVTPKKQLTWAMGVFQASMVMGVMFGPLVGGMIADTLGYRMPFVIFCALSFFCLAAVRLMVPKQIGQEPARERESFAKQLSYFMKNPRRPADGHAAVSLQLRYDRDRSDPPALYQGNDGWRCYGGRDDRRDHHLHRRRYERHLFSECLAPC